MGFIIKPVVTEKMNAVTEKSSVDKTIKVANENWPRSIMLLPRLVTTL